MTTLPSWISQSRTGSDIVAPIKARACLALHAVLRNTAAGTVGPRMMERGVERC